MKHFSLIVSIVLVVAACQPNIIDCDSGIGDFMSVSSEGQVIFHEGFERFVIRHHVEGTIDSFNTYVPCNLPADLQQEGLTIQFSGESQKLKKSKEPSSMVAGEEFYTLLISSADVPR